MNYEELKRKTEATLFSYANWIHIKEIMRILNIPSETTVRSILNELKEKYKEGYGFHIEESEDKWRMVVKEEYEDLINELLTNVEIPKSALKVLAVIAYEQPITKTRLNEIIGHSVVREINYLLKEGFISYKKKGIGRYYKITKKFKDYFKVEDLSNLQEIKKKLEKK